MGLVRRRGAYSVADLLLAAGTMLILRRSPWHCALLLVALILLLFLPLVLLLRLTGPAPNPLPPSLVWQQATVVAAAAAAAAQPFVFGTCAVWNARIGDRYLSPSGVAATPAVAGPAMASLYVLACSVCNETFRGAGALETHRRARHPRSLTGNAERSAATSLRPSYTLPRSGSSTMPSAAMASAPGRDELSHSGDGEVLQPAQRRRLTEPESLDRNMPTAPGEVYSPGEPGGGYDMDERDYYHGDGDEGGQAEIGGPDLDARTQTEPERGDENASSDDGSAGAGDVPPRRGSRVRQPNRWYADSSDEEAAVAGGGGDEIGPDDYPDFTGPPSEVESEASEPGSDNEGASDRLPTVVRVTMERDPDPLASSERAGLPRGSFSSVMVDFAAGVAAHSLSMGQADWVLQFIADHTGDDLSQLPRQHRTVLEHNRRWSAWFGHPSLAWPTMPADAVDGLEFHEAYVEVDGHRIAVWVRDAWAVLVHTFLENDAIASLLHFGYTPERDAVDGSPKYSEMWTAEWWRQEELKLKILQDLLAILLHYDETPYWKKSVAPVCLSIGNASAALRRRHDMMPVVAYVPKLVGLENEKKTPQYRRTKRLLLHAILQYVLQPLHEARERGGVACKIGGYDRVLVPDLLHDADLGVFKRFVLAIFAWLEENARLAADELDRRIRILTGHPLPAIRRFGTGGFRGLERKEGAHFRSVMTVLPLALLNLPAAGLDIDSLVVLAADWVGLYADLRLPSISSLRLDAWQARAADFGGRLRQQLVILGDGDGVFPKLHALLGGHVRDAVRQFGVVAGYDSAPFESRHRTAVKQPARLASRAVDPLAQMASSVRRREIVQQLGAVAGAVRGAPTAHDGDDDHGTDVPGLSWAAKHLGRAVPARSLATLDLAAAWPHANVTSVASANALHKITANWLAAQALPHVLSSMDASKATVELLRRLNTRDGARAYAHPSFHGAGRFDDIAVLGTGGETWYARIVGLARFSFPAGGPRAREGVLVRWYEKAAPAVLADLSDAVRTALAPCPLVYAGKLDWIAPEQALRRVGVVPCWFTDPAATSARPVVSPPAGSPMYWFVNEFYHKIHSANKDLAVAVDEEEEEEDNEEEGE